MRSLESESPFLILSFAICSCASLTSRLGIITFDRDDSGSKNVIYDGVNDAFELLLKLLHEEGGIIVTILNLSELLLPESCQLRALQ